MKLSARIACEALTGDIMNEKVFEILQNSTEYVSGQDISKELNVSRQAVWKAINSLKEMGFEIDSVTNKGYKVLSSPKNICELALKNCLDTNSLGKNIVVLDTTDSTNNNLKKLARNGAVDGTVVVAREQTSGKGRLGRSWISNKDENLTFSVLLRPNISPMEVSAITPIAGLAVCKAINETFQINCKIKWPNDIIAGNKKLVGILTEMSAEMDAVDFIVIGIGINLDQAEFDDEIKHKATSVFLETNKKIDKNKFLANVLKYIEDEFASCNYRFTEQNIMEYKNLCATINKQVGFYKNGEQKTGTAVDINSKGELVVRLDDQSLHIVNSGEVTIQGIY